MYLRGWHSSYIPWLYLHNPVTVRFYRRLLNFMFDGNFTIQFFNNQHVVPSLNPSKPNDHILQVAWTQLTKAQGGFLLVDSSEWWSRAVIIYDTNATNATCVRDIATNISYICNLHHVWSRTPKCWFHFSWPSITWSQKWGITNQVAAAAWLQALENLEAPVIREPPSLDNEDVGFRFYGVSWLIRGPGFPWDPGLMYGIWWKPHGKSLDFFCKNCR